MHTASSGQVGIIVLLIVVVLLTVGVSVVSRTTSDLSNSTSNQAASRALDAADSGVEQALSQDLTTIPQGQQQQVSGIPNATNVAFTVRQLSYLQTTAELGTSASIDVRGVPNNTVSLTIDWSKEAGCATDNPASLVITIYKEIGSTPPVRRVFAGSCTHSPDDGFTIENPGSNGYFRTVTVPLDTSDAIVRIRPVYNRTELKVTGNGWQLPTQIYTIHSTAQSANGQETQAVEVNRGLPMPPAIFEYVLYSGTSITQ